MSLSSQSSVENKHTKRQTPEDKVKPTSAYRQTHKCLQPAETHTLLHDDSGPTSSAPGEFNTTITHQYSKYHLEKHCEILQKMIKLGKQSH